MHEPPKSDFKRSTRGARQRLIRQSIRFKNLPSKIDGRPDHVQA
jgi:hypothetical protein